MFLHLPYLIVCRLSTRHLYHLFDQNYPQCGHILFMVLKSILCCFFAIFIQDLCFCFIYKFIYFFPLGFFQYLTYFRVRILNWCKFHIIINISPRIKIFIIRITKISLKVTRLMKIMMR